jgi:hypothetical protein
MAQQQISYSDNPSLLLFVEQLKQLALGFKHMSNKCEYGSCSQAARRMYTSALSLFVFVDALFASG